MPAYVETLNQLLSLGTIFLQFAIVALLLNLIFFRSHTNQILIFFKKYTFVIGFLIALTSTMLSLFYSNVVGFPPCELCWINRIFIYPQVILFGMELYKRDKAIVDQTMVLAILSALVSIFHVYVENGEHLRLLVQWADRQRYLVPHCTSMNLAILLYLLWP